MRPTATALTVLLLSAAGMQVGAQAVPGSLHDCMSITSDKQRLACFDREMAKLYGTATKDGATASGDGKANVQASTGSPTSGDGKTNVQASTGNPTSGDGKTNAQASTGNPTSGVKATAPPAASLAPERTFGLSGEQILQLEARQGGGTPPAKLKSLTAQIASVSHNAEGRWVFTLDNGQVWRQTETRSFEASPGAAVRISSGAMGSFWIETSKHNWTRVERVL
jgi:hypothetical protein